MATIQDKNIIDKCVIKNIKFTLKLVAIMSKFVKYRYRNEYDVRKIKINKKETS